MAEIIFDYKGNKAAIQCLKEDKIRDICLKFTSKIHININNIYLLYNGEIINMELKYNEIANRIDNNSNIMNILVYDKENNGIICPYCGENININIDDAINKIIKNNDNIKNILNGIKEQIKNIINLNNKEINNIIYQLKNILYIMDIINEDIRKNNEEINKINNINNINKNIIEGIIDINVEDINKDIKLYNSKEDIEIYINNERIINENKYKFDKKGKYKFKLIFKNKISNLKGLFERCLQLYPINLSNLDTSNVTDMSFMFNKCKKLKEIKGINKFNTNNVTNMNTSLENLMN